MKKVIIKLAIALGVGLLIFEFSGNIYISNKLFKIEKIIDTVFVKQTIFPEGHFDLYKKMHDVRLFTRTYSDFKDDYNDLTDANELYNYLRSIRVGNGRALTLSKEEFFDKYFLPLRDTLVIGYFKKKVIQKKRLQIGLRDYFNKRIAYTFGISMFSVLLLVLILPELKN